jgi:hypothetical protein
MAELLSSKVVVLEKPPTIRSLPIIPTSIPTFIGTAARGPIRTPTYVSSWAEYKKIYGAYAANADMTLAVWGYFYNGGTACWCSRTCHYTTITNPATFTALQASVIIQDRGTAALPAVVNSTDGPWHLNAGDHFDLDFDNNGTQVATILATAAFVTGTNAETFNLGASEALTFKINLGFLQTVTFLAGDFAVPGAATAEEVCAKINAVIVDGYAVVTGAGTTVTIYSDLLGTSSKVEIVGGVAAGILGLAAGVVSGSGNVANTRSVSAAEIAAIITALPPLGSGTATVNSLKVKLTSGATGVLAEVEVVGTTVQRVSVFTVGVTNGSAAGTNPTLQVKGKYPGIYGNNISVQVTAPTSGEADEFNLVVMGSSIIEETFPNLSMTDADINYVEDVINNADTGSDLIEVIDLDSPSSTPTDLPALGTYSLTAGDDGLAGLTDTDYIGDSGAQTGLYAFDIVLDFAVGPLAPNRCTSAVQNAQVDYAEIHRNKFSFVPLGPPANNTKQQIVTYVGTTAALEGKSEFGAIYWPRVKIVNPDTAIYGTSDSVTIDPVGIIAGIYARTDGSLPGGVYRAPAGIEYGRLIGVVGFETDDVLNEGTRDYVDSHHINPLRADPGTPRYIDGCDCLKTDSNFPTVPERRGVIYIERTIKSGLEVWRHSPNDQRTRTEAQSTITAFLIDQMKLRAFRTEDPSTAFFVDADIPGTGINPPTVQFSRKLYVDIGLATNKPNKWIILSFSQDVRALQEQLAEA